FASKFHEMKRGLVVGEESGGGYYGNTSGINKLLILPHTKLRVNLNFIKYHNHREQSESPFGRGVMPDHSVLPNALTIAEGQDAELDWLLEFMAND
ncbi:MAG: hypothetical protein AAF804_00810, partial [Bacteroidota bacterium]